MQFRQLVVMSLALVFLLGFKPASHVAIANQALDELDGTISGAEPTVAFHDLVASVANDPSAYAAILAFPEQFRMGSIGPDAFPDVGSGQLFHHVNRGVRRIPDLSDDLIDYVLSPRASDVIFEARTPNSWRSIDVGMAMLELALSPQYRDRAEVLSFVMGYLSHMAGDSFAHARVNELSGGVFDYTRGTGSFDELTEELKHAAIEDFWDQFLPSDLTNTMPGMDNLDRLAGVAPTDFLDDFYSQGAAFDFNGGYLYDWFNLQEEIFKGLALILNPIRAVDLLDQRLRSITVEALDTVTGGVLPAAQLDAFANQIIAQLPVEPLADVVDKWDLLVRNTQTLEREVVAYRKNWVLLSECTMQNLAQMNATLDREDRCADPEILGRLDFNGVQFPQLPFFQQKLRDLFLATDAEPDADRRSFGFNLGRLTDYLKQSFKLDQARDILLPLSVDDSFALLDAFLEAHRDEINQGLILSLSPDIASAIVAANATVCTANCFIGACNPANLQACVNDTTDTCNNFCNREFAGFNINICAPDPCGLIPGCADFVAGLIGELPGICDIADPLLSCIDVLAQQGIDCAGCTTECQTDAPGILAELDLAGLIQEGLGESKAVWDDFKEQLEDYVIEQVEPAACTVVQGIAKDQLNDLRNLAGWSQYLFAERDPTMLPDYFAVNVTFLMEDFARDASYRTATRSAASSQSSDAVAALDALEAGMGSSFFELPDDPGFEQGCFSFSFETLDRTGQAAALKAVPELHMMPGPTATDLEREMGGDLRESMPSFINAVAGAKLLPMRDRGDVESLFAAAGMPVGGAPAQSPRLPWNDALAGGSQSFIYSDICSDLGDGSINLLCDAANSLDDPTCFNCLSVSSMMDPAHPLLSMKVPALGPNPPRGENPFAGELDLHTNEDSTGILWRYNLDACASDIDRGRFGRRNVRTPFVLANTDAAFENVYTRVFRCGAEIMPFADFDDPEDVDGWEVSGNGNGSFDPDRQSRGDGSMRVCGDGYISLVSPRFDTLDWVRISDTVAIDLFVPDDPANPWWWGSLQMQVHVPAAGLDTAWVGQVELTNNVTLGAWNTVEFVLPPDVFQALIDDFPNARLQFNINGNGSAQCWGLDELRSTGNTFFNNKLHVIGSRNLEVATNALMSFEVAGDWTSSSTSVSQDLMLVEHGSASLQVQGAGYSLVSSRMFSTDELDVVGSQLNLDLFVPEPQPNLSWVGQTQLFVSCPSGGIYNTYLGAVELSHTFFDEFNSLLFDVPGNVQGAFLGSVPDCQFDIVLNVVAGSGSFRFDKLGFVGDLVAK